MALPARHQLFLRGTEHLKRAAPTSAQPAGSFLMKDRLPRRSNWAEPAQTPSTPIRLPPQRRARNLRRGRARPAGVSSSGACRRTPAPCAADLLHIERHVRHPRMQIGVWVTQGS
jgi:hypothetical protein